MDAVDMFLGRFILGVEDLVGESEGDVDCLEDRAFELEFFPFLLAWDVVFGFGEEEHGAEDFDQAGDDLGFGVEIAEGD